MPYFLHRALLFLPIFPSNRLINGKRCEILSECWSFNIRTQKHQNLATVHYTTRPFGLCLCKDCAKGLSTTVPSSSFAASHERVDDRTLDFPFHDSQDERQGPVVITGDIKQIEKSYRGASDRTSILNQILKEVDEEADDDEGAIIKSLVAVHKDAEGKADEFLEARAELERQRSLAAQKEKGAKRLVKMKEIYAELSNLLGDFEHKDIALAVEWNENRIGQPHAAFECDLSQELLSGLFSAVSNASKKKIRTASEEVRRVYSLAASKNLLSTLKDAVFFLADSPEPADQMLYKYFSANDHDKARKILFEAFGAVKWLESATSADILNTLLTYEVRSNSSDVFYVSWPGMKFDLGPAFAQTIIDDEMEKCDELRKVAEHAWCLGWDDICNSHLGTKVETIRHAFPLLEIRYEHARASISEYLARPEVVSYMETPGASPRHPSITRRVVVERSVIMDAQSLSWVLGRGYFHLRIRQECMFDDPFGTFRYAFVDLIGDAHG